MTDLEIMTRVQELEGQLKQLRKLEREKEKLKDDCKHNIIVITSVDNCYSIEAKCLFCGRRFRTNRELYDYKGLIDISEYYCVFWDTDKMISEIKNMYKDIVSQNENVQPNEIGNMIKERFKQKYHESKVILEDIAKKVRGEV